MEQWSDRELVLSIQNGDIFAFEQLVKMYQRGLFSFAYRIVQNAGAAEEIVQDALFKAYRAIDRVDPEKKFSTYIFEITKNTAISVLRTQKHTVSLEEIVDVSDDEDFFLRLIKEDEAKRIHGIINTLSEKYRSVITLYYFDELSYEEISSKLHIPVNTVRTHLLRAKEQLKKLLYENT